MRVKEQIEVIRTIRNHISHSASRKLTEYDFNEKWKDLETAVLNIVNDIDPSYKDHEAKQIAELKVADVTHKELLKFIDEKIKHEGSILYNRNQEAAQDSELREHVFKLGNLKIKISYEYHHPSPKTTEQPSRSWKCCLCLPSNGSRHFDLVDENLSEEEKSPSVKLVKWTLHPPDNWDVEKIQEKLKYNSSSLTYFDKESIDNRSLVFGKKFLRVVVEDHKKLKSETESVFKQTFEVCGIDVKIDAEISVNCLVKDIPKDQSAGEFSKEFHLKNTLQVHVEIATCTNHPDRNLVDIKTFKDGRIVIVDKNLHQLILFSGKGQDMRTIRLDGGPTSLDIIDNTTVCVTFPKDSLVTIIDINSGEPKKNIKVEGKCCSIIYKKDYFFVGCENRTLKVLSLSGDMKQHVFPLQFEPSGICGKIIDDRRIFCIFCQSTKDNNIFRIEIDVHDTTKFSNSFPEHVTLKQTIGTVHFGLSIDDDDNLLYLDNTKVFKAYDDATNTLVLSPNKEISCMHYDMSSKTLLLVTVGCEIMFYEKSNTRL